MISFEGYVACICEGSAEKAIIELLFENDKLIFTKEQLLDGKVISVRNAEKFEKKYLNKKFDKTIDIVRVLDSRNEKFKLKKVYEPKINIHNVLTTPEIEMLIIHAENKYDDFDKVKSNLKPSEYCKQKLKMPDVKSYDFVKDYFSDIDKLILAIRTYRSKIKPVKGKLYLSDLLKD